MAGQRTRSGSACVIRCWKLEGRLLQRVTPVAGIGCAGARAGRASGSTPLPVTCLYVLRSSSTGGQLGVPEFVRAREVPFGGIGHSQQHLIVDRRVPLELITSERTGGVL
jgi:hypothetical protein